MGNATSVSEPQTEQNSSDGFQSAAQSSSTQIDKSQPPCSVKTFSATDQKVEERVSSIKAFIASNNSSSYSPHTHRPLSNRRLPPIKDVHYSRLGKMPAVKLVSSPNTQKPIRPHTQGTVKICRPAIRNSSFSSSFSNEAEKSLPEVPALPVILDKLNELSQSRKRQMNHVQNDVKSGSSDDECINNGTNDDEIKRRKRRRVDDATVSTTVNESSPPFTESGVAQAPLAKTVVNNFDSISNVMSMDHSSMTSTPALRKSDGHKRTALASSLSSSQRTQAKMEGYGLLSASFDEPLYKKSVKLPFSTNSRDASLRGSPLLIDQLESASESESRISVTPLASLRNSPRASPVPMLKSDSPLPKILRNRQPNVVFPKPEYPSSGFVATLEDRMLDERTAKSRIQQLMGYEEVNPPAGILTPAKPQVVMPIVHPKIPVLSDHAAAESAFVFGEALRAASGANNGEVRETEKKPEIKQNINENNNSSGFNQGSISAYMKTSENLTSAASTSAATLTKSPLVSSIENSRSNEDGFSEKKTSRSLDLSHNILASGTPDSGLPSYNLSTSSVQQTPAASSALAQPASNSVPSPSLAMSSSLPISENSSTAKTNPMTSDPDVRKPNGPLSSVNSKPSLDGAVPNSSFKNNALPIIAQPISSGPSSTSSANIYSFGVTSTTPLPVSASSATPAPLTFGINSQKAVSIASTIQPFSFTSQPTTSSSSGTNSSSIPSVFGSVTLPATSASIANPATAGSNAMPFSFGSAAVSSTGSVGLFGTSKPAPAAAAAFGSMQQPASTINVLPFGFDTSATTSSLQTSANTTNTLFGSSASTPAVLSSLVQASQDASAGASTKPFSFGSANPSSSSAVFGVDSTSKAPPAYGNIPQTHSSANKPFAFGSNVSQASGFSAIPSASAGIFGSGASSQSSVQFGANTTSPAGIFCSSITAQPFAPFAASSAAPAGIFGSTTTTQASTPFTASFASAAGKFGSSSQSSASINASSVTNAGAFGFSTSSAPSSFFSNNIQIAPTAEAKSPFGGAAITTVSSSAFGTTHTTTAPAFGSGSLSAVFPSNAQASSLGSSVAKPVFAFGTATTSSASVGFGSNLTAFGASTSSVPQFGADSTTGIAKPAQSIASMPQTDASKSLFQFGPTQSSGSSSVLSFGEAQKPSLFTGDKSSSGAFQSTLADAKTAGFNFSGFNSGAAPSFGSTGGTNIPTFTSGSQPPGAGMFSMGTSSKGPRRKTRK